jgi:hypothetical protein
MRTLIALAVVIYFVGIGVVLSPTIQTNWRSASASDLVATVAHELPNAVVWPARAFHSVTDHG